MVHVPLLCNQLVAHLKITLALDATGWRSITFVSSVTKRGQPVRIHMVVHGSVD